MNRSDKNIHASSLLLRCCIGLAATAAGGLCPGLLTSTAWCDVVPNSDGRLDYGLDGLDIPPEPLANGTTPRTAQLMGEGLRRAIGTAAKVQFIREIGMCQLPQSLPLVKPLIADSDPMIRAEACAAIETLANCPGTAGGLKDIIRKDRELTRALEKVLAEDSESPCRIAALDALVALQGPDSPAILAAASTRPVPDAALIIRALVHAGRPSHLEMVQRLWPSLPESTRLIAARTLGRIGDAKGAALVLPLSKGDVPARIAAMEALGGMKLTSQVAVVAAGIADPHPSVRRAAVAALQTVADAQTRRRDGLVMLKDPDSTVRLTAVELLAANIVPELAKPFAAQLTDRYQPIYAASLKALWASPDPASRQACIDVAASLLDNSDPRRQQDGSYILGRYRSDAALQRHIAIAATFENSKPDWALVSQAVDSLGRIGHPDAKPCVLKLAGQDPATANTPQTETISAIANAMIACGRLGEKAVLPICHKAMAGNPERMASILRTAAAYGIGAVGTVADTGSFPGVMGGGQAAYESPQTRIEVLRAIGNLRDKAKLSLTGASTILGADEQWMAHWAHDRITGQTTPFTPRAITWNADVSIRDMVAEP